MTRAITPSQQTMLDFIKSHIDRNGWPPTLSEISNHFGYKSTNSAASKLAWMARKGLLEIVPGMARGIRLPKEARSCPHCGGAV